MSAAREAVLERVRAAVEGSPLAPLPRAYRTAGTLSRGAVLERFRERVADYRAQVRVVTDVAGAVERALVENGAARVGIDPGLPVLLRPGGIELVEDSGLGSAELDRLDGAVTTCAAACAETGTIALDGGPGQGRRALTLVPDLHVCVVAADQVVETVPELIALLAPAAREGRPIVLVSGPSATSDIELERVEGVHGPRRLVVLITA